MKGFHSQSLSSFVSNAALYNDIPRLRLCDIGFNAIDEVFRGVYHGKTCHKDDFVDILERAHSTGVHAALCTGSNTQESKDTIGLCRQFKEVSPVNLLGTVGIHPCRCLEFQEAPPEEVIRNLELIIEDGIKDGSIAAIGECGLDYDRLNYCSKEYQLIGFEAQLQMATKYSLPLFLHNRNTEGDFFRLMSKYRGQLPMGGVVHSFTDSVEEMKELVDLGLFIGINGCSMKTEENIKMVAEVPIDSLLLETDAPWCSIKPSHASYPFLTTHFPNTKKEKQQDGKLVKDRSEPCQLIQVLEVVAKLHNMEPIDLAQRVEANTRRLFPTIFKDEKHT